MNEHHVGAIIQRLRHKQRLSEQALALRLGTSQATISRIENGQSSTLFSLEPYKRMIAILKPKKDDKALLDKYIGQHTSHSIYKFLNTNHSSTYKDIEGKWLSIEQSARLRRMFCPWATPALLKTQLHNRKSFYWLGGRYTKGINEALAKRHERQKIVLSKDHQFEFLFLENVLFTLRYNTRAWQTQLKKLERITKLKNVTILIVPYQRSLPPITSGAFSLFDSNRVAIELGSAEYLNSDQAIIEEYEKLYQEIREQAVDEVKSREMIWDTIELAQKQ